MGLRRATSTRHQRVTMTRFRAIPGRPTKQQRASANCGKASKELCDARELDLKLDLALGAPEDLSAYADCIRAARIGGVSDG